MKILDKKFKEFIDNSLSCISIVDYETGIILYSNKKFNMIFGKNKDVIGSKCIDLMDICIRDYFDKKSISIESEIKINNKYLLINSSKIDNLIFSIYTDITKIKEYDKNMKISFSKLEEDKRKAEKSDMLKSSFLSNVSHEIRTPLNSIIGFSRLLLNANKLKRKKYFNIIEKNSKSLLYIIDDIIDLSKIETNEIKIKSNKCVLYEILLNLYENYKHKIKDKKNFKLLLNKNLTNVIIYTDEYRLKQILENLISNAIKFTKEGYVKFGYKLEQKVIIFYVEDTGIGINPNDFDYIFERFTQLDETNSKPYKGTGLGLSITKKLVNILGGKIWLESELNKGTTFYFTIPSDYTQKISNEYDNINKYEKKEINWKNKKILIIENDEYSSFLLIELIKKTNIKCDFVKLGLDAINKVKEYNYDIILMDIKLPDIHGYNLIKIIKRYKNIPIIALAVSNYNQLEILENGFDGCIKKPIETYKLLKILNKYFN